jgi:hypothetical protein
MAKMTNQNAFKLRSQIEPMKKSKVNPWIREYEKTVKRQHHHTTGTEFVIATNGADAQPVATFTNTYPVDKEQFCKIYLSAAEAFVPLTSAGRKVFVVLFNQVRKNIGKDMVQMAFLHVSEVKIEIKQGTYTKGVRDLYDNDFIAPVEGLPNTWWVNPDYIFNGNRLNINNTYLLKETIDNDTGEINKEQAYAEAA